MQFGLADVRKGKILPANYPSIQHLPGSKMIDKEDHLIGPSQIEWLTVKRRNPSDIVIITEKIDGMNAGVARVDDELIPLVRRGYDCRTNPMPWIQSFAEYVAYNRNRFLDLLCNDERVCGEWMIKTHTLAYKISGEPFVPFDIIYGTTHERREYFTMCHRVRMVGFEPTPLVHAGIAISTEDVMKMLGKGYSGVIGDPEGVVYRYQKADGKTECMAKFVANPLLGNREVFQANADKFNEVARRFRVYQRL